MLGGSLSIVISVPFVSAYLTVGALAEIPISPWLYS